MPQVYYTDNTFLPWRYKSGIQGGLLGGGGWGEDQNACATRPGSDNITSKKSHVISHVIISESGLNQYLLDRRYWLNTDIIPQIYYMGFLRVFIRNDNKIIAGRVG